MTNGATLADALGWTVERLAPTLGARVTGANLAELTDDVVAAMQQLLGEYLVLAFDAQTLTPDEHVAIGQVFGTPYLHPYLKPVPEHPAILEVIKEADDIATFGGEYWHADITFEDPPASASVLYARELPPLGGDTLFANQQFAFATLSPTMQERLRNLRAVHLYPGMSEDDPQAMATHDVIRHNPRNGADSLYVNAAFVSRFDGMTQQESAGLLEFLFAHQVRPEGSLRLQWSDDMVAIWDNGSVIHYATNDYPGHRRELRRVTAMEQPKP